MKFHGIPLIWLRLSNPTNDQDVAVFRAFHEWQRENNIFPAVSHGGNFAGAGYKPDDARRVIQWWKDHDGEIDPTMFAN